MADNPNANYVFLPWTRQGAASGIQTPDRSANQAGVVSVAVKLRINDTSDILQQVRLYGPGDITGIDPQQIIRTEPRHQTMDFEPNYFPAIEFDRPDFPWLFTPAKADAAGLLRPWLCLVVVRKQKGVTLSTDRNLPLPVLEIDDPEHELPNLSESWAWAHAQITRSDNNISLEEALTGDPALTVSRLLCPRRLDPRTEYLACVVPAFELGRKAGLGLPITSDDEKVLKPAWVLGEQPSKPVTLPVYFHWEFSTGVGDDFEALVAKLAPLDLQDMQEKVKKIGKRRMDISQPGLKISPPLPKGTILELEGALRLLDAEASKWLENTPAPFQTELKDILNEPWRTLKAKSEESPVPLLAPPIYGSWQAARHTVDLVPTPPLTALPWLDELNLDPRYRAVAAMGTQVVQTQQEQLMASAWEQLGEFERTNQIRRLAQLSRKVNGAYYARHFQKFSSETLLKVTAPAQSRIVLEPAEANGTRALLSQKIARSMLPSRAISAPMRRLTSPRSAISTRFLAAGASPIALVANLSNTAFILDQKKETGLVTINEVSDNHGGTFAAPLKQAIRFENISDALDTAPLLSDFKVAPEGIVPKRCLLDFRPGPPDSADAQAFRNAAKELQNYLTQKAFAPSGIPSPALILDLSVNKDVLLKSINPEKTTHARVRASLSLVGGTSQQSDSLEPIMDSPVFPQPMYEALRDLSQDFLFPGLEHVPPNTVALLETNSKFVESFLVGLNAEMSRELLWRGYPTDQRGTYFRQFWDTLADNVQRDIQPINTWEDRKLGDNVHAGEQLVLLIRSELLRRYPNSVIYAVRATKNGAQLDLSDDERHPLFRGTLKPDVTFLGFGIKKHEAIGDPGWFFVIQQQPTEPRFGMDEANFDDQRPPLTTWNNLSWRHLTLTDTEAELKALSHVLIDPMRPEALPADIRALSNSNKAKWGRNSAHQAYITLQRPVRIAIHASEMIKQD